MFLTKSASGIYYIIYDNKGGKRTKISTKSKIKSNAHKFLIKFSNHLLEIQNQKHIHLDLHKFSLVYSKHSESIHTSKTNRSVNQILKNFKRYVGNPQLHEISLQEIQNYIQLKRDVSIHTGQRYLAYLRSAFNYACKQKYLLHNHFNDISNFNLPEKQPKFFSPDEYNNLVESIDESWFRNIIEFAFNTGMRQMEIIQLLWDDIDFNSQIILITNHKHISKNKKIRVIPMNRRSRQILLALYKGRNEGNVFTYHEGIVKPDHISKKFKKHVRRLDINQSLNFHSLHHTFASRLV